MAACVCASGYRRRFVHLLRQSAVASVPHISGTHNGSSDFHQFGNKQYSTGEPGARFTKWLSRRFLAVLALAGFTGGALFVVSIAYKGYYALLTNSVYSILNFKGICQNITM